MSSEMSANSGVRDVSAPLRGATIVVAVGGGIAAYKACELVRLLDKAGAKVWVTMTKRAAGFVSPLTFQALTGHPVFTDLFSLTEEASIGHIQLADRADLMIVAPATASLIARLAAGMADDAVTAVALATKAQVLLAPSMNSNMWSHPITRRNVQAMAALPHVTVVGPGEGFLACRWTGPGRLAEPADIVEAAAGLLSRQDLAGKRVVISAGPTQEAIDPARYVGNRSSGKMGVALAQAARRRGAEVTLVLGPSAVAVPLGVTAVAVTTALEMQRAVNAASEGADCVIMAAAVADFRPKVAVQEKIKRGKLGGAMELSLVAKRDFLAGLGARRGMAATPLLVGFAAETSRVVEHAMEKLTKKQCDLIVANDVSRPGIGFGAERNAVTIVGRDAQGAGEAVVVAALEGDKGAVAHGILDQVVLRLQGGAAARGVEVAAAAVGTAAATGMRTKSRKAEPPRAGKPKRR
jgi:phosphopantothenoylcysteine decarboxylase/phosphopantothenate--cysteine ligase